MGAYRKISMKVTSKDQIPWAKGVILAASQGCNLWVLISDAIEGGDDETVARYFNGTLTKKEQEQLSKYFRSREEYYQIDWIENDKEIIANPICDDMPYEFLNDFYHICEEIVINDSKREFTFEAEFNQSYLGLSSRTKCEVYNGKFNYSAWKVDPTIASGDPDEVEQSHIVKGKLVNGKYEFEVYSEFITDDY